MRATDSMTIECEKDPGRTMVRLNVHCDSVEDIRNIISWLALAQDVMTAWQNIHVNSKQEKGDGSEGTG